MAQQRSLARYPGSIYPGSPRLGDLFEQFLEEMHDYDDSSSIFTWAEIPKVDIRETKKAVVVEAEIPGMTGEDIDVTVNGDYLRIKGEKRHESKQENDQYYRAERRYGTFERTVKLPAEVTENKSCATYKNGVLTISLPKKKASEQEARRIEVKSA